MQTDEFEWDDAKAALNFDKHRISFEEATFAFDDPDGVEDMDETASYDEHRFKWLGSDGQRLLAVIYTDRNSRKRIISAREADDDEQADYDQSRRNREP